MKKWNGNTLGKDGQTLPMSLYRASLLQGRQRASSASANGAPSAGWTSRPPGPKRLSTAQLFTAQQSWTLPALSRGLLYVMQNEDDRITGTAAPADLL